MNKTIPVLCLLGLFCLGFLHVPASAETNSLAVKIISLRNGERVHGKISIEATVNQPGMLKFIDFYIQEPGAKDRYGWKDYSAPYFWGGDFLMLDTTLFNDGPASVAAFGRTIDKSLAHPGDRVHFIIDNGKPVVKITAPVNQAGINGDSLIQVSAFDKKSLRTAAGIASVSIYLDGGLICKLNKKPFQVLLKTCLMSPGLHSLRAVAEDFEGMHGIDNVVFSLNPEADHLVFK